MKGGKTQFAIEKFRLYPHGDDPVNEHAFGYTTDPDDKFDDPEWYEHVRTVDCYWNMDLGPNFEGVSIFTIEIINPTDARAHDEDFKIAKMK